MKRAGRDFSGNMKGNIFVSFLEKQGVRTKRNFWGEDE